MGDGIVGMVYGMIVMDDLSAKFNFLSFSFPPPPPSFFLLAQNLWEVDDSPASKLAVMWIEI